MEPSPAESQTSSATVDKSAGSQDADSKTSTPSNQNAENTAPQIAKCSRLCGVCNKVPGKYKCPKCTISYCSVACSRTHNENHPPPTQPAKKEPSSESRTAGDQHKDDPYHVLLEHASEFQRLFKKYPNLETELIRIHEASLPPRDDGASGAAPPGPMRWKVKVPNQAHKEPWTRDVGLRMAASALRSARTDPGETGDAVREYCDLVLHLLSGSGRDAAAAEAVRREVAAEELRTVERLLAEEGDRP